ncbi:uncharacterized protein STEHIDRAFT_122352 [Stereum hirsutum FP-91666 SS1]|uniref:uncharacterized protein n=1 Tax=Stereum hirsutum (strain FP-91666) TaxID=721885 RepID=UPI000444A7B6|nr:uncharacterized protein STEHIDRAFT_122352 [Stereum hirsutum FP-91666 SS1]EIM85415.1 hypothetical protein STEHIDRAFT_122352 [Stereum hirsutum FP-91666 SS1]
MAVSTTASQEEMKQYKLPIGFRDRCSALLIPLNVCRKDSFYLPWKCEDERHVFEKCQYEDYLRRMKANSKLKQQMADEAAEV